MTDQQERKRHIRSFLRAHYSDEKLAALLAHAQDGKLSFCSCCCFIGIPTADHALRGWDASTNDAGHLNAAHFLSGATMAEQAFCLLVPRDQGYSVKDIGRRRILIPMVKAEMRRRAALRAELAELAALESK